jgi:hypothetical protein
MRARTHDGRSVRILNLIDEYTRECLLIRAARRWSSAKVIGALADVMVMRRIPEHLRSDNEPEFVAKDLRKWLADSGAKHCTSNPAIPGRTATVNLSTASCEMSSSTENFSTRSRNCVCWPNAGASTTTPSDHTPRWDISHQYRRHGRPNGRYLNTTMDCATLTPPWHKQSDKRADGNLRSIEEIAGRHFDREATVADVEHGIVVLRGSCRCMRRRCRPGRPSFRVSMPASTKKLCRGLSVSSMVADMP